MSDESRRTIAELLARYELEPELLDVYVEGVLDREILGQTEYCAKCGVVLYEIDTVDVPTTVLQKFGLTKGNKQRVIALSKEFCKLPECARVLCLVDRDLDHWFSKLQPTPRLRWTAYSSIESHFLTPPTVVNILIISGRSRITKHNELFLSLAEALRKLFALRLADRELGLSMQWIAPKRYLACRGDSVVLDSGRYIVALLNKNSNAALLSSFTERYEGWLDELSGDIRFAVRGHDLTELLCWAINAFGGLREVASEVAIERFYVLLARNLPLIGHELQ